MEMNEKIKMAITHSGISQAQIAREIGMTPSNFNQKLKRETFTYEEMNKIACALSAKYICVFKFEDGAEF